MWQFLLLNFDLFSPKYNHKKKSQAHLNLAQRTWWRMINPSICLVILSNSSMSHWSFLRTIFLSLTHGKAFDWVRVIFHAFSRCRHSFFFFVLPNFYFCSVSGKVEKAQTSEAWSLRISLLVVLKDSSQSFCSCWNKTKFSLTYLRPSVRYSFFILFNWQ